MQSESAFKQNGSFVYIPYSKLLTRTIIHFHHPLQPSIKFFLLRTLRITDHLKKAFTILIVRDKKKKRETIKCESNDILSVVITLHCRLHLVKYGIFCVKNRRTYTKHTTYNTFLHVFFFCSSKNLRPSNSIFLNLYLHIIQ